MERYLRRLTLPAKDTHRARWWRIRWAVAAAVLIAAAAHTASGAVAPGPSSVARIGSPAPNFTLQLLDGKAVTLSSFRGKAVVVNFWHSG